MILVGPEFAPTERVLYPWRPLASDTPGRDGDLELHHFVEALGPPRPTYSYFGLFRHFALDRGRHVRAIRLGAVEVPYGELLRRLKVEVR